MTRQLKGKVTVTCKGCGLIFTGKPGQRYCCGECALRKFQKTFRQNAREAAQEPSYSAAEEEDD